MPSTSRAIRALLLALVATLALPPAVSELGAQQAPAKIRARAGEWVPDRYRAALDSARSMLTRVRDAEGIPGVSVAVIADGRLVWSEGIGYADLESRAAVTPLTRFRIGSISKSFTAQALGLLVEQGRLDLDAPVQQYVPSFPRKRWPITTRQVAGHVAGIRHYRGDEMLSSRHYPDVRSALTIFEDDSLLFEPGTRYLYSSYGFNLISAVVEGASGEPFLQYMRAHVLQPLDLRSVTAEHVDSLIPWRARFYDRSADGRVLNAPYVDQSNKWAGGGFISNAEDVARYGWSQVEGGELKPETVALLTTSQRTRDGKETGYGMGWFTGTDDAGRRWFGHTGGSVGGRSVLVVYPRERVVVAVLANLGQAPMSTALGSRLAAPFIGAGK